jgi:iron complex outermembrane receptor protein
VFDGTTFSLRATHKLGADWQLVAHAAQQRLKTDDREAFPFGCTASDGTYYADRYCPDGTFDLYDFRSENERRRQSAVDVRAEGRVATGAIARPGGRRACARG